MLDPYFRNVDLSWKAKVRFLQRYSWFNALIWYSSMSL